MADRAAHRGRWTKATITGVIALWAAATATGLDGNKDQGTRTFAGLLAVVSAAYAFDRATLGWRVRRKMRSNPGRPGWVWVGDVTTTTTYITPVPYRMSSKQIHGFIDDGKALIRYPISSMSKTERATWSEPMPATLWTVDHFVVARAADGRVLWPSGSPKRFPYKPWEPSSPVQPASASDKPPLAPPASAWPPPRT